MITSKETNIPWNKFNITKLVITLLLILLQVTNVAKLIYTASRERNNVFDADYYDPVVKIMTFVSI